MGYVSQFAKKNVEFCIEHRFILRPEGFILDVRTSHLLHSD